MKFDIPKSHHIRWQAALAVLEDIAADKRAVLDMDRYGCGNWDKPQCGTPCRFAGWIVASPYCRDLGVPSYGSGAVWWLTTNGYDKCNLWYMLFDWKLQKSTKAKTIAFLKKRLKDSFKESTGKTLTALVEY